MSQMSQQDNISSFINWKRSIRPPFPPNINPKDLIKKSRDGVYIRAPNAFIIYRKLFIETSRNEGYYLPMTVISVMSSQSWEQESEMVKNEYKRIAKEAFDYRKELIPKTKQRRKREKWNIVSFENNNNSSVKKIINSSNDNHDDKLLILQHEQKLQNPTPYSISSPFQENSKFDFNFPQHLVSPPTPEISIENNNFFEMENENLLEFQNVCTLQNNCTNSELPSNNFNSYELNDQFYEFTPIDKYYESHNIQQDEVQNYQQVETTYSTYIDGLEIYY
ncbi:hypothetical protein RhiirA1_448453 [Rhizophagus irregularis]|uniref:MATA-HMG n=1 Tax=Rhizophagus irregularis TaxID=588596 RepID=A0A2N0SJK9_9GLOM|nr:hypothetical protein RhiirA1_448453 [Rhizophagus irregularis]CAB4475936.1 unnamed protein product [Rhizophagus irregularis]